MAIKEWLLMCPKGQEEVVAPTLQMVCTMPVKVLLAGEGHHEQGDANGTVRPLRH